MQRLALAGDVHTAVNPTAQRAGRSERGVPSVRTLAMAGDVDGLVEASFFEELLPGSDGGTVDLGAQVREQAILALGKLGPETGNGSVVGRLVDPSDRVRMAAVQVLHDRGEAEPLAEALAWLPTGAGHSRRLALEALADLHRSDSARTLAGALLRASDDRPIGADETDLLVTLVQGETSSDVTTGVIEELLAALADDREMVADRAEVLLAALGGASIEGLISELRAGAAPHRAAAVLGRIKATRAIDSLVEALEHPAANVRAESAAALGELRDPVAVEPLLHATRDPEHAVRAQAGWALDRIGTVAVIVGVSQLVGPMIQEAVGPVADAPALPEPEPDPEPEPKPAAALPKGQDKSDPTAIRRFARFLDRFEDARRGPTGS